jgi:hypothetical protein
MHDEDIHKRENRPIRIGNIIEGWADSVSKFSADTRGRLSWERKLKEEPRLYLGLVGSGIWLFSMASRRDETGWVRKDTGLLSKLFDSNTCKFSVVKSDQIIGWRGSSSLLMWQIHFCSLQRCRP